MHVVVNWLWQGLALTIVAGVAMRGAPRLSATTRYLIWWTAMILVLLLPVLPWLMTLTGSPAGSPDALPALTPLPLPVLPAWPLLVGAACWALWVVVALARVILSLAWLVQARRSATPFPGAREARLTHWTSVRSTGRRARLVRSDCVASAAVLGLGNVVIAVSPAAARRLTDEELDQVLLHEWAHVQRRDDFARLAQIAVRSVAGLHPAVWWIGRRLEIEREIACDDFAINISGGARTLALSLTKLAEPPARAISAALAPGALVSSQLSLRVLRLLDPRRNTSTRRPGGLIGSAATALAVVAVVLSQMELVGAASPLVERMSQAPDVDLSARPALARPSAGSAAGETVVSRVEATLPESPGSRQPPRAAGQAAGVTPPSTTALPSADDTARAPAGIDPAGRDAWAIPDLPSVSSVVHLPLTTEPAAAAPGADGQAERKATTPWGLAADAGISMGHGSQKAASATADAGTSVGRGSQKAAVATAGFFSKLGRKIAGGF